MEGENYFQNQPNYKYIGVQLVQLIASAPLPTSKWKNNYDADKWTFDSEWQAIDAYSSTVVLGWVWTFLCCWWIVGSLLR